MGVLGGEGGSRCVRGSQLMCKKAAGRTFASLRKFEEENKSVWHMKYL